MLEKKFKKQEFYGTKLYTVYIVNKSFQGCCFFFRRKGFLSDLQKMIDYNYLSLSFNSFKPTVFV